MFNILLFLHDCEGNTKIYSPRKTIFSLQSCNKCIICDLLLNKIIVKDSFMITWYTAPWQYKPIFVKLYNLPCKTAVIVKELINYLYILNICPLLFSILLPLLSAGEFKTG